MRDVRMRVWKEDPIKNDKETEGDIGLNIANKKQLHLPKTEHKATSSKKLTNFSTSNENTSAFIQTTRFSRHVKVKSSTKGALPLWIISLFIFICSLFPETIVHIVFSSDDLLKLNQDVPWVSDRITPIFKYLLIAFSVGIFSVGLKEINNGTLHIHESYVVLKKLFQKPIKIHFKEVASIDVHRSPFSFLFDLGTIEVTDGKKDIF